MPLYVLWKCQAWRESNIHCHNYFNEREWRRRFSAICQQAAVMAQAGLYSLTNCSSVLHTEFSITSSRSTAFIIFPGSLWSPQIIAPKQLINFVVCSWSSQCVTCSSLHSPASPASHTHRGDQRVAQALVPLSNVEIPSSGSALGNGEGALNLFHLFLTGLLYLRKKSPSNAVCQQVVGKPEGKEDWQFLYFSIQLFSWLFWLLL